MLGAHQRLINSRRARLLKIDARQVASGCAAASRLKARVSQVRATRAVFVHHVGTSKTSVRRRLSQCSLAADRPQCCARPRRRRHVGYVGRGSVITLLSPDGSCKLADRRPSRVRRRSCACVRQANRDVVRIVDRCLTVSCESIVGLALAILAARSKVADNLAVERLLARANGHVLSRA